MEPDEHEIYKFLGSEQAHGIQMKTMFERIIKEGRNTKLNDANLIKAINMKVIPVAVYSMQ